MPVTNHLLMQMPCPVAVMMGPEFVITLANDPLLQLWGKPAADIIGRSYFSVFPDRVSYLSPLYRQVLESGQVLVRDEVPVQFDVGGKQIQGFYKIILTPVVNETGQVEGVMSTGIDITTEVSRRKQLETTQSHFSNLISQVAAGIVQLDLGGRIIEANDRFCQLVDTPSAELQGKSFLSLVYPEEADTLGARIGHCIDTGADLLMEHRLNSKAGNQVWVSSSMSRIRNAGQEPFLTLICINIQRQRDTMAQLEAKIKEVSDYQFALDKSAIVAITNQRGVIQYVNEYFCNISGYSAAELIGQDHRIINSGYHPKAFFQNLWATITAGKIWKGEIRNRAKNGQHYWVDTTIVPFLDASGKPYQYVAIRNDVTQRKVAEERIRESEERYATVVEASDLGLWDFDVRNGKLIAAGRMASLYGLPSNEDYTLERVMESVHPDDRAEQDHVLEQIIKGKVRTTFETEFRIIDQAAGNVKWLRARAKAFFDHEGQLYRTVGTAADITAARKAQELLGESEERLKLVIDAAGLGMWDYNLQTDTTVLSEKTRDYYGLGPEEPFTFETFLETVHPDDRAAVAESNRAVLFGDSASDQYFAEFRIINRQGQVRWNRSFGRVLRNKRGERYRFIGAILDVTEEREAAEALIKREQEFRSLAENTPDIILRHDPEFRFVYANPQVVQTLGYTPEQLLGRHIRDLSLPEPIVRFMEEQLSFVAQHKAPHSLEYPSLDGQFWYYSRLVPELGPSGELVAILVITTDITFRKKAETALRESESRFRTMANSIPQLAWMTDPDGNIYWYNQRWFDYTGTSLEEMQGWGWQKVHHPDLVEGVVRRLRKAFAEGTDWEDTFMLRNRNGQYRWFLSRAVPVRMEDGRIQGWFGTNTDITQERQTAEALKLAKDQLELTFQNVPAAIYLVDRDGQLLYLNQKAAEALGFASADEVQTHTTIYTLREQLDKAYEARDEEGKPLAFDQGSIGTTMRTRQPSDVLTQLVHKQTGAYFWLQSHSAPMFDEQGNLLMVLTTTTDVTDQRMFTEKLEQEVAKRTQELQRSNEDLQQFAHAASHDLKEPVRKVLTFLDRTLKEYSDQMPEKAVFYLQRVEVAARRSFAMIDGLLHYSKVDAAADLQQEIDLVNLLQQLQQDLELPIQQKQATLVYGQLPYLTGAPELVYQLMYNLLTNALKFVHPQRKPVVRVWGRQADEAGWVWVEIADNGIGFDPGQADRIFQTYTRLHSKDLYEGSGLGLALCRRIVERHGGSISATGSPGAGARFTIRFPGTWER